MENYPAGNKALIAQLGLLKHPEGGYFVETDRQPETVPSPFASTSPIQCKNSVSQGVTDNIRQGGTEPCDVDLLPLVPRQPEWRHSHEQIRGNFPAFMS